VSGGSYDYLCFKEFLQYEEQLERMANRLADLGYAGASDETYRVLSVLREVDRNAKLHDAWMAIEWLDSNDNGIEQTHTALQELGWKRIT